MRKSLVYGGTSTGLLASFSQSDDSQSWCWKTSQTSFEWADPTLLEALPQSGMTASGRLYQLHNVEHPTCESDGLQSLTPAPLDTIFATNSLLPTPSAHEHKYRLKGNSQASRCLEAQARRTGKDFQLNPQFVEEMMGFPIGWTDLEHSETQSSHSAQSGLENK